MTQQSYVVEVYIESGGESHASHAGGHWQPKIRSTNSPGSLIHRIREATRKDGIARRVSRSDGVVFATVKYSNGRVATTLNDIGWKALMSGR